MSILKKSILLLFFIFLIFDFYDCTQADIKTGVWLRPLQLQVLSLFIFQKKAPLLNNLLLIGSLVLSSVTEFLFNSTGLSSENIIIYLLLLKKLCFLIVLSKGITSKIQLSNRLVRWAINYLLISVAVCFLMVGFENMLYYILAIESGLILLLISMQERNVDLFKQLYLGYVMVILAMVFGKILIVDSRWFVEIITRFMLLFGHLFFLSALAKIKLIPLNSNPFDYQTVNRKQNDNYENKNRFS